jgi:hypothetical protein
MRSTEKPWNEIGFTADHQSTDDQRHSRTTPWRVWSATAITTLALTSAAPAANGETPEWQQDLFEIGLVLGLLFLWSAIFPPKKKKNGEDEDSGSDFEFDFSRRRRRDGDDKDSDGDGDGGGCGGGCGGGD